jgi:hypothetical protein
MLTEELGGLEAAREALARERLEELQALARTYRNWSVKELAHALGRQPGRLVPESGMPKIDLVVGLAKALDWPVDAVVEHLMKPASDGRSAGIRQDKTEDYARQSADFRRSCDSLRKAAKAKNLDGAALAWMEVTMKCVQCHKYVRDERPPNN